MRAARIADGDVRPDYARESTPCPPSARAPAARRADAARCLHRPRRIRIGNPHVDFHLAVKIVGQCNQFDSRGEIANNSAPMVAGYPTRSIVSQAQEFGSLLLCYTERAARDSKGLAIIDLTWKK